MARRILAALAAACALVVAGCASTPPQAPPFPTAAADATTAAPSETPSDDPAPACADTDAEQALADALPQMPPPFPPDDENMSDVQWDTEHADLEGYDPCAELSWITISIVGGTGSSPSQVALFHAGEFVQAATEKSYGFWPQVTRLAPDSLEVVYFWPKPGEGNAERSGESPMRFTWDDESGSVLVEGDPPNYL